MQAVKRDLPQTDVFVEAGRESLRELREKEGLVLIPYSRGFDRRHVKRVICVQAESVARA